MYHSIIISGKNTWTEWKLIPSSRPLVEMPDMVIEAVKIPGRSGTQDLSEALVGHPLYNNRVGNWEFYVTNDYVDYDWVALRNELASFIHGKQHTIVLEDEPGWEYEGRLFFNWSTEGDWSKVTISYDLKPFAHRINLYESYQNITVDPSARVGITGYDEWVVPSFDVTSYAHTGLEVEVNGEFYHLSDGTFTDPRIAIGPGRTFLTFYGNGKVTINYRGGKL